MLTLGGMYMGVPLVLSSITSTTKGFVFGVRVALERPRIIADTNRYLPPWVTFHRRVVSLNPNDATARVMKDSPCGGVWDGLQREGRGQ